MTKPELAGMRDTCVMPNCSRDTVERKLRDPGSDFPKPFVIHNNRYWRRADIRAWIAEQALTAPVQARTLDAQVAFGYMGILMQSGNLPVIDNTLGVTRGT